MNKRIIRIVNVALKDHKKTYVIDGFREWSCPIEEQRHIRVAPKGEWRGTEKERKEALKEQNKMDKMIGCDFCDLCKELLKEVNK